jgi:arylsulfatase A-like enzyme
MRAALHAVSRRLRTLRPGPKLWLAVLSGTTSLLFSQPVAGDEGPATKPNVLWIWADNLAYADLGVYGNRRNRTPVIDRLAHEGVRFTQYYVAHTVCSPSRAALLTGRQPFRVGIVDVLRPDSPSGIPSDEIMLAEALRDVGYETMALGKWHLGDRPEFLPTRHGFDHYFGLPYSMDMLPTLLYRDDGIIEELPGDEVQGITARFTDEAIRFIASNRSRPFFLYFSHTLPHPPLNLPPERRRTGHTPYQDAIEYLDQQTGVLLDALRQHGLTNNTLVIFTSDNGPMGSGGDTGTLRGRIRDAHEGGIRVPFIARWPGRIPAGRVVDTPAIAYDVFPTLLRLAGGRLPSDRVYDGQDIGPLLDGRGAVERQKPFIWVYTDGVTAIRDGRWKLHLAHRDEPLETPELYDVEKDPAESRSLTDEYPEVVRRLQERAREFQTQIPYVWSLKYSVRDPAKRQGGVRRR